MPRPKKVENNDQTVEILNKIVDKLSSLEERVLKIEETKRPVAVAEAPSATAPTEDLGAPIPTEYASIVHQTLNHKFSIKLIPRNDSPHFEFIVNVPEEYSTVPRDHRRTLGGDIRVWVISYAEGTHGVKRFCEKIYETFSNELKAKITADRVY